MFLTLVDAIFLCAFYAVIAYSVAPFVLKQDTSYLSFLPWAFAPIVGRSLLRFLIAKLIAKLSLNIENTIRTELICKLLKVGPLSTTVKGSLSTLFVDALDDIMPYFTNFLVAMRYAMIIPVVILVAVAYISPWSSLILFAMAPLIPFFMIVIGKGAERLNQRQWVQITRLAMRFQEALEKLTLIKLFNIQRQEIAKIVRLTKRWRVETMQVLRIAFLSALVLEFFATCGIALCAITLGFAVYEHGYDYTKALFILLLAPEFFLPLRQLGLNYHARMRALGAMSSLMQFFAEKEIFNLPPQMVSQEAQATNKEDSSSANLNLKAPFTFELKKVTATYPNGRIGLQNVSCVLKPRQVTALIGRSGSGKSTLLQSLCGFTQIDGTILVNGVPCDHNQLTKLMPQIAYIPQLPHLFYGTLRDNLKIGAPDASDQELIVALHKVGAQELLVRFTDGLDHQVGDLNRGISGGETRLIAIARALIRNCPIILLDEPTASLDINSENIFLQSLKEIAKDKTVIMVAHREGLIAWADEVLDLSKLNHLVLTKDSSSKQNNN